MKKIVIIGAGSMASAFCFPCVDNGNTTYLVGTHLENDFISKIQENKFHPALKINLPNNLIIEKHDKLNEVLSSADIIVAGISSVGINWFTEQISKNYKKNLPIILLTKGLSVFENKILTLSEKIKKNLRNFSSDEINISAVKGPCLASGLANKMRTGAVLANENINIAKDLSSLIATDYYSIEITSDINGVELSGAIKNIYSMLIGASKGLSNLEASDDIKDKYYLNTAASLVHRSVSEMSKFIEANNGSISTVYGLAGLGDLYVSAIGGRNSLMGKYLGDGYLYLEAKEKFMKNITVEGAELAKEIGPFILKNYSKKDFPLMFNLIESICNNKKLKIDW
ncbi:glycerol-3-phosphate dehydrogenase [Candidatus Pelagibacter sp.]|nr:glycerol-3-phosphate dehydrogenase [Candidatus Pelagibacter sp.]